jgi:hypothetical protein
MFGALLLLVVLFSFVIYLKVTKLGYFDLSELLFEFKNLSLITILFIIAYVLTHISENLVLVVDEKGIQRYYVDGHNTTFLSKYLNYSYSWNDVLSVEASKGTRKLRVQLKTQIQPLLIPLYLWEIKESDIDLKEVPMPWNNISLMRYDISNAHIIKSVRAWIPLGIEFEVFEQPFALKNHADLGGKIKIIAMLSAGFVFVYALSMPLADGIYLFNGFFENKIIPFGIMYFLLGIYLLLKELKNESKRVGAVITAILFAGTSTIATAGALTILTKYYHTNQSIEFRLVNTDKKTMVWKSDNPKWSQIRIKFEHDFERSIKQGDKINLVVHKGLYGIYTATIDDFDKAIKIYED